MHDFELRKQVESLRARLESIKLDLAGAIDDLGKVDAGICELDARRRPSIEKAVDDVDGMRNEQRHHIEDARQRGQGAGLYKALDTAADLDRQQAELLHEARQPGIDGAREALRRYTDLERQQLEVISDELGKFEAQGMKTLYDRFRELADQQQKILAELLGAR